MSPARTTRAEPGNLDLLNRGKRNRAVKRPDAHLETVEPVDIEAVPEPYDPRSAGALDESERADLATCEQAVAGLQRALATAGKALATINAARLYRETHTSFEAYVEERWDMKRANAYRLINAWPVAARLSPRGDTPEKHIRALLPAVKRHGLEAAVAVYEVLREQPTAVTTSRVEQAVRTLPRQISAPDQARYAVLQAVAEGRITTPGPRPSGDDDVVDAEIVQDASIVGLAVLLDRQRKLYDDLGGGVIAAALAADAGRAEELLRELGRYASRTAHRARQTPGGDQ